MFRADDGVTLATSADNKTVATFSKPGVVRIRAEAVRKQGAQAVTLGKTPEYNVQVDTPAVSLRFEPEKACVGQAVQVQLVSEAAGLDFSAYDVVWQSPEDRQAIAGAAIRFEPQDTRPVQVAVQLRAKAVAGVIAEAKRSFQAQPTDIAVRVVGPSGEVPEVWDEASRKLVTLRPGQYAVNQGIQLQAQAPTRRSPDALQFVWTVREGNLRSGAGGPAVVVAGSRTGACTVSVAVRGKTAARLDAGRRRSKCRSARRNWRKRRPRPRTGRGKWPGC